MVNDVSKPPLIKRHTTSNKTLSIKKHPAEQGALITNLNKPNVSLPRH